MKSEFASFVNFLNNFANKSSEILTKKFRKKFNFESKKDGSFVTDIDKEIEELFRRKVKQVYPLLTVQEGLVELPLIEIVIILKMLFFPPLKVLFMKKTVL